MKKNIYRLYFSGLLVVPLVLFLLPADFFDKGPPMCLSVILLDMECYGCGMTRAIMHLLHFDYHAAASFNKISFVVLPVLVYYWFTEVKRSYRIIRKQKVGV